MRRLSKHRPFAVGVTAALVGLVAASAGLSETSFTDPTGDPTNGAPDVTQVVASNDTAGVITFRVTTAAPIGSLSDVFVDLDTDSNPSTGSNGAELSLDGWIGGFAIDKWDGKTFVKTTAPSLGMTISGSTVEFRIGRQDLGNIDRFGFAAYTVIYDSSGKFLGEDDSPDGGSYIYVLAFPQCANGKDDDNDGKIDGQDLGCSSQTDELESDDPVTLKAGKAKLLPATPKAGKAVVVSTSVTRVETGLGVTSGTVRCAARVGTKALKGAGKMAAGRASCRFTMPATSKGKVARGTITVTVLAHTKVVPFSFKVN
jgi:hypothetical protein